MIEAANLPAFSANDWFGIVAPAGTPREIVHQLNAALVEIVNSQDTRLRLAEQGAQPITDSPAEFEAFIKSELRKWSAVIQNAHVTAN